MSLTGEKFDWEAVERSLCRIAEIEAARVVVGRDNVISELHILALPDKGPKQIVRDIESILMAKHGLAVDRRKISIAQLGAEELTKNNHQHNSTSRLRIGSVSTEVNELNLQVSVELVEDGGSFTGRAEGVVSQSGGGLRLVAEATLRAVEKRLAGSYRFSLEEIKVIEMGREEVAVAGVTLISGRGEKSLSGSAIVKTSYNDTAVKAVLDAVNRQA